MCALVVDRIDTYQFNRYVRKETVHDIIVELSMYRWHDVDRCSFQSPGKELEYHVFVGGVVCVDDDGAEEDFLGKRVSASEYEALNSDLLLYGLNWAEIELAAHTSSGLDTQQRRRYRSGRDWDKAPTQAVAIQRRYRVNETDVINARDSADALGSIFHCPAFSYVIGCHISPQGQELAMTTGVRVILIPDRPYFHLDYRPSNAQ